MCHALRHPAHGAHRLGQDSCNARLADRYPHRTDLGRFGAGPLPRHGYRHGQPDRATSLVTRTHWSTSSSRKTATLPPVSLPDAGPPRPTSTSAARCLCWSVAPCCISRHCCGAGRPCHQADKATRAAIEAEAAAHGSRHYMPNSPHMTRRPLPGWHQNDAQQIQRAKSSTSPARPCRHCWHWETAWPRTEELPLLACSLGPQRAAPAHCRTFRADAGRWPRRTNWPGCAKISPDTRTALVRCVGYRQAWETRQASSRTKELCDRGIFATRQLAKRQITWLSNTFDLMEQFDCLSPTH